MQKVSFIRALLSKPDLLILDESTANLIQKQCTFLPIASKLKYYDFKLNSFFDKFTSNDIELQFKLEEGITTIQEIT